MMDVSLEAARRAKPKAREAASRLTRVTGAGITRVGGVYVVKINLQGPEQPSLPHHVDGVRVVYEVTGPVRSRAAGSRPG